MHRCNASSIQVQWLGFELWGAGKLERSFDSEKELRIGDGCSFAQAKKGAKKGIVDGKL
jgi:hypothetical protein